MRLRDHAEYPAARRARVGKLTVTEGAVSNDGYVVPFAPGNHSVFDGALLQVIEHLVAGGHRLSGDRLELTEVRHIEVADAPRPDLAVLAKLLKGRDGVFKGMAAAPMKKVAIQVVRAEPSEGVFACRDGALPGGILGKDFGDEEYLIATAADGLVHPFFGYPGQIHFRRIDVTHPEIDPPAQGGDRGIAIVIIAVPSPLTDNRDLTLGGIESS
jgi:hypothetical protein